MLVLSRKKNEAIRIGEDITIVLVELRGDKARIGIEAPSDIPVHRQEVYDAIHRNAQKETMRALETTDLTAPQEPSNG